MKESPYSVLLRTGPLKIQRREEGNYPITWHGKWAGTLRSSEAKREKQLLCEQAVAFAPIRCYYFVTAFQPRAIEIGMFVDKDVSKHVIL